MNDFFVLVRLIEVILDFFLLFDGGFMLHFWLMDLLDNYLLVFILFILRFSLNLNFWAVLDNLIFRLRFSFVLNCSNF
jgi:hypothetical protein